ncbi:hypothetical protein HGM15179_014994 [Zosterops borbonicus]|uniref:Uncharacterized protein n=1 Tax=Zosterops borbonicus TaxID=364589 RepID=A0A8K1G5Q1_9PASS|nr:hypothetical protein HGM15179_014994 [Zosterops borbonicus]
MSEDQLFQIQAQQFGPVDAETSSLSPATTALGLEDLAQRHRGSSCVTRFALALVTLLWSVRAMSEDQLFQIQAQQFGPVDAETSSLSPATTALGLEDLAQDDASLDVYASI